MAANNKDPAFLFYPSDFLTGTMLMNDEQVGKYIKLLCLQHQQGHLSEKHMLQICKTYDEDIYSKFSLDENGLYYNKRLDDEANRRREYSESRRKNRTPKQEDMKNICKTYVPTYVPTYVEHMETETVTETITKNITKKKEQKHIYGEYENVKLTDTEYQKLIDEYGQEKAYKAIQYLSRYREDKGYKNKSDYLSLKRWVFDAAEKQTKSSNPFKDYYLKEVENEQNRSGLSNGDHQDLLPRILPPDFGD